MLSEKLNPAAHAGEAQASNTLDPREAYWEEVEAEMVRLSATVQLRATAVRAVIGGAA